MDSALSLGVNPCRSVANPSRSIAIANRHPRLRVDAARLKRVIAILDSEFRIPGADVRSLARSPTRGLVSPVPAGELSLVFLEDTALAQLHGQFLNDPTPTDVITFEGDPAHDSAGEICVSADAAANFARAERKDFSSELTLYVVHGWLHLAGYDDLSPARKRVMRRAEARALGLLSGRCEPRKIFVLTPGVARETHPKKR
jgi:probable rRNA maturation factor